MVVIEELRSAINGEVFDYQTVMYFLRSYKKPRDKITQLLRNKSIIKIKKGIYAFGSSHRKSLLSLEIVAALLVQPSYISKEYALDHYGIFPEHVHVVTSMTTRKRKRFSTPLGMFDYYSLSNAKFGVGVEVKELPGEGNYLLATKEKALADWIASVPRIPDVDSLYFFLFEESRIEKSSLFPLKKNLLKTIAFTYQNHNVSLLLKL